MSINADAGSRQLVDIIQAARIDIKLFGAVVELAEYESEDKRISFEIGLDTNLAFRFYPDSTVNIVSYEESGIATVNYLSRHYEFKLILEFVSDLMVLSKASEIIEERNA